MNDGQVSVTISPKGRELRSTWKKKLQGYVRIKKCGERVETEGKSEGENNVSAPSLLQTVRVTAR